MTMSIWKFEIPAEQRSVVEMPRGARVLSTDAQGNNLYVWALVDQDAPKVPHGFLLLGTGHTVLPDDVDLYTFVGTTLLHGGALVLHLFDRGEVIQ